MFETVKNEMVEFIGYHIPQLSGKVSSTYPDSGRYSSPSAVVDIIASSGTNFLTGRRDRFLIRISIISDNGLEVDQLSENLLEQMNEHYSIFDTFHNAGINSVSPLVPAFWEKQNVWRRDIDIVGVTINVR